MRLTSTSGGALAIACALLACGSFGEGATANPPNEDGGGVDGAPLGDGGPATTNDSGGTAAPIPCAQRSGVLLCEDFEGNNPIGEWEKEEVLGGRVGVNAEATRGGSNVLRARLAPATERAVAQISRDVTWTFPIDVRFFAYVDGALADPDYHILVVLQTIELGIVGGRMVVNQFEPPAFYETAPNPLPSGKWTCVEWHVDASATTLSLDGVVAKTVTQTTIEEPSRFVVGLAHARPTSADGTLWYDDVVVSKTPVGCN